MATLDGSLVDASARGYRVAMLRAFAFPVCIFLVVPALIPIFANPKSLVGLGSSVLVVVGSVLAVGLVLAPWAGVHASSNKIPSFLMSAAAAAAGVLPLLAWSYLEGALDVVLPLVAVYLLLALPASLWGAMLFIGACEQLDALGIRCSPTGASRRTTGGL